MLRTNLFSGLSHHLHPLVYVLLLFGKPTNLLLINFNRNSQIMLVIKSRFFDLSEMADLVLLANAVH